VIMLSHEMLPCRKEADLAQTLVGNGYLGVMRSEWSRFLA
jgi:hypothetical protein